MRVGSLLIQVPVTNSTLQSRPDLLNKIVCTNRPIKEAINVAAFVCTGEQVMQLKEVDVTAIISAKTFVFVIVLHHG